MPAGASPSAATGTPWPSARRTRAAARRASTATRTTTRCTASGAVYVFVRNGAGGRSRPTSSHRILRWAPSSATPSRSAPTATRWPSRPSGKRANRPASTAIRDDHSIPQAGAAYVFTRSGTTWTQQAYIKASNTGEAGASADSFGDGDQFGVSMTLSDDGRTLAVGAITEDSARPASTATRPTTRRHRRAPCTCSHSRATPGRSRHTSRPATPTRVTCSATACRSAPTATRSPSAVSTRADPSRGINGPPDNMRRGAGAVYVFTRTGDDVDAAGLHPCLQRRSRRFVRGQRRAERRWEYAAGELAGRRLHRDRRQPARLRQRSGRRHLHRRRVRVRAQRRHVDAAGVPEGLQHWSQRLVRLARRIERRRQHRRSSTRRSRTARERASTASRTTTQRSESGAVYVFTRTGTTLEAAVLREELERRSL